MKYKIRTSHKKISDKYVGTIIFLFPTILAIFIQHYSFKYILILVSTIIICELIGIIISFYLNKIRTPKSSYDFEYYRDYGFDSPPAIVARFIQKNSSDENDLFATILDLYIKKYINIENSVSPSIKETLQKTDNLEISLNTDRDINNLLPYEQYLIKWIFSNSNCIYLKDFLKKDLESGDHFNTWKSLVEQEFIIKQYFDEDTHTQKIIEFLTIPIAFLFLFPFLTFGYKIPIMVFIISTIILTFCSRIMLNTSGNILTQKGIDEFKKIKGYIKYIKDYSLLKDSSSESIVIWNQYLTYSIALNLTPKINKELKKVLGEDLYIIKGISTI